ncbi:hypothetical protein RRG08_047608 [Elysia crispata]|uniref:Uncharacterized protein n=1 Tax=Elysia crispata TaxID=231223 RepID=A0AAE1BDK4_9GAST|nr:hypothetical protein RRG08_047608 [Elysia crispata]
MRTTVLRLKWPKEKANILEVDLVIVLTSVDTWRVSNPGLECQEDNDLTPGDDVWVVLPMLYLTNICGFVAPAAAEDVLLTL